MCQRAYRCVYVCVNVRSCVCATDMCTSAYSICTQLRTPDPDSFATILPHPDAFVTSIHHPLHDLKQRRRKLPKHNQLQTLHPRSHTASTPGDVSTLKEPAYAFMGLHPGTNCRGLEGAGASFRTGVEGAESKQPGTICLPLMGVRGGEEVALELLAPLEPLALVLAAVA